MCGTDGSQGAFNIRTMEDDDSFLKSSYTVNLTKSRGLGEGIKGYGIQFAPTGKGPVVVRVFTGGEADRSGLLQVCAAAPAAPAAAAAEAEAEADAEADADADAGGDDDASR